MASDSKRHSMASKPAVALPNVPPAQNLASLQAALVDAIGARVRLAIANPVSAAHEGSLFTADPTTGLVVINTNPEAGSYRIIPISRIQSFTIVQTKGASGADTSFPGGNPSISALNMPSLRAREDAAVRRLKEQELKRGKNVTAEAQEIFNALTRTMPGRWDGQDMVISDNVLITKPYRMEDCRPVNDSVSGAAVHRVRKVLEMERKKLELRRSSINLRDTPPKASGPTNVNGQRKGG